MSKFEAKLADALGGLIKENSRESFDSILNKNPRDWTTRLVYADWLEDHDELHRSQFERYMADNQIAPAIVDGQFGFSMWGWDIKYNNETNEYGDQPNQGITSDLAKLIVTRLGLDQYELFDEAVGRPFKDIGNGIATYYGQRVWRLRFRTRHDAEYVIFELAPWQILDR